MLKLKIWLTAKSECKKYGTQAVANADMWEKLPFIAKYLKECSVAHEKIIAKERKANKIFRNIKAVQANYIQILLDCKTELERIESALKHQEERIASVELELKIRNTQIQAFNENKPLNTTETIFQIIDRAESLAEQINILEAEKEELYKQIEITKTNTKKRLDEKYKELISGYTDFSVRTGIVTAKIEQKIIAIKNYAVLYTEYFWTYYIRQYIKRKRREGIKRDDIILPLKPELNTEKFKISSDLFAEEKKEINNFNSKYKINYTI